MIDFLFFVAVICASVGFFFFMGAIFEVLRRTPPVLDAHRGGASPNPPPRTFAAVPPARDSATGEGWGPTTCPPPLPIQAWQLIARGGTVTK